MATSDARFIPIKASAYRRGFVVLSSTGEPIQNLTFTSSKISKDQTALANTTNSITTASGGYVHYIELTAAEMNADEIVYVATHDQEGAPSVWFVIHPKEAGDLPVTLEANQDVRNVTGAVATVTALSAGSLNNAAINADTQGKFIPDILFTRDNVQNRDEYTVQFLNAATGAPLPAASITGNVTITVRLRDAGTTPISAVAMTAVGDGSTYSYNGTSRIPAGDTGIVTFGVTHSTFGALSMRKSFVGRDTA